MEMGIIRSIQHLKFEVLYGFTERKKKNHHKKPPDLRAEVLSQFHALLTNSITVH